MSTTRNHEAISPTAKLVAFWRSFSDIPFSQDVSVFCETERVTKEMFAGILSSEHGQSILPALLEIRYKSLRQFLLRNHYSQVLEFASGVSLRGLAMTSDPAMTYVETDLPTITGEKKKLVSAIEDKHGLSARPNLFFNVANILNYDEIEPALAPFSTEKPLAIINEGLVQYLPMQEKFAAAKNIHRILKKYSGAWITPDLDTMSQLHGLALAPEQFKTFIDVIEKVTGCNFETNSFKDEDDVKRFFNDLGFNVRYESQVQDDVTVSSLAGNANLTRLREALGSLRLWILTAK